MVVWLASYPRSGNKYLRLLLEEAGVRTFSIYYEPLEEPFPKSLTHLDSLAETCVLKTHEMPKEDARKSIFLVRDGRDALVSYAHLSAEAPILGLVGAKLRTRVLQGKLVAEAKSARWSEMAEAWASKSMVVRYEDLVVDPQGQLNRVLGWLDLPAQEVVVPSFSTLHASRPHYFRKGTSGQWRTEMPKSVQKVFWKNHGPAMESFGYVQ